MFPLKDEEIESYNNKKICYFWKKKFNDFDDSNDDSNDNDDINDDKLDDRKFDGNAAGLEDVDDDCYDHHDDDSDYSDKEMNPISFDGDVEGLDDRWLGWCWVDDNDRNDN